MGKPYDHEYHFAGVLTSCGDMVCKRCNQPIFNHNQDWMSYKKSCIDAAGWPDWGFLCFHRKCAEDQSPWEKIERKQKAYKDRADQIARKFKDLAHELGIACPYEFAEMAASALGGNLDDHYIGMYGSC